MNLVIVGGQWGDEGKGKIVDFLAERAEIVLRYSGGANAGHTVVIGEETYKFHLIPSGIVHPGKKVVLGIGMVIDPENLFAELKILDEKKIPWQGRVFLADRAHLVLPRYKELDRKMDKERAQPLGTTGRGIGVAYALKSHRAGIRVADIFDGEIWPQLPESDRSYLDPYRDRIREMVVDVSSLLQKHRGSNVLLEGAQGLLLDLDFGTYPYVSSGMSSAAGAAVGAGIGPQRIDRVLGVFKAYTSRVGNGPFPSAFSEERDGKLEETIREIGREYGVTTGRPRSCGYLDLVGLKYACRCNSIDSLVLTHLDVYDNLAQIKACTAYDVDGTNLHDFPASLSTLNRAQPILESFDGWQTDIKNCQSYEDLPQQARDYICFIEEYTETPIDIISVGYERSETIVRKDPWTPS